mmetsp:Transcript_24440/g.32563  ORF Transcript_24440/g.32563 Transcript_24440/m.32563 type:complete len:101 (-) Transcript_24440:1329-1631(-)
MSDEGASAAGGDDLSGLSGFFFYVFIVHPCTAWILRPGRFERKKSIMYAIAFLAALAAIKTGEFIVLGNYFHDFILFRKGMRGVQVFLQTMVLAPDGVAI